MRLLVVALVFTLAGCASSHKVGDGVNPLGGGVSAKEISENLWFITAETNFAPWENLSTARKMWSEQAKSSCKEKEYTEYETSEYVREHVQAVWIAKYLISAKSGYAACGSSSFTKEEIASRIQLPVNSAPDFICEKKLDYPGDLGQFFEAGKSYYVANSYEKAKPCFELSADGGAGNKEAMKYLGFMYEFGKGVPKSLDTAKFWYQKAGTTAN